MKKSINEKINEIALQVVGDSDLELVHAQVAGTSKNLTIRIFLDKPGGITHEDCVEVSRKIEEVLDADDFISSSYTLEVSSPGLERDLYSLNDFAKFAGSLVKVKTNSAIEGQKNFRGKIINVEGEQITFEDKTKGTVQFPYSAVAKANLEIDLEEELKRAKN